MFKWLALAGFLLPGIASAQEGFQLPSGNVFCAVEENALRCDLVEFSFTRPPRPQDCDTDWGHAYSLGARGGARALCAGDTVVNRGARRLRYGERWDGAGVTCHAERTGLHCINADGRGFDLARSRLGLF
ncbi:DUF6636 domain-containing protein [Falsiroseomonas selenitidurans]|uniref:Uncharacterized protein n=1 Tax=Falsiroseomonas selenitidurans TaxID=2716335 RepID=A0ABX1DYV9_9PROT|nr:DUF6636 domain-containing protein [Falsiroseomonas selenitidurans]NKC29668.1 hypothetical protein [Falsiroseomonas selenitidurans]